MAAQRDLWFVPQPWAEDALCATIDPELWYPEYGSGVGRQSKAAVALCLQCNVREQCLAYALENDERWGIWGGLTETQRKKMRKSDG